jgi:hypothetical protein
LGEDVVNVAVGVGAAVCEDVDPVIAIGGVAHGGEHHATGGDAGEDDSVDVPAAELLVEIGSGEGADPGLADDDVTRFGGDVVMDGGLGCLVVQETAGCCERGERLVGGGNRLMVGVVERDPEVGDMHTCLSDGRYALGEASEEGSATLSEARTAG